MPYLVENENYAMPADAHAPGILPAGEGAAHHEEVWQPQASVGGEFLERTDVRNLKAEANKLIHLMTHFPKNPHRSACMRAKMCAKNALVREHDSDEAPSSSVSRSRRITSSLRMLWTKVYWGTARL